MSPKNRISIKGSMIGYGEAIGLVQKIASRRRLSAEEVDRGSICGRVAASDYFAEEAIPAFDNAAMDGFAIASALTEQATPAQPVTLPVEGFVAAGDPPISFEAPLGAIEIMTGARLPSESFDSVVRVEDVTCLRGTDGKATRIEIRTPVTRGTNVRRSGEDYSIGTPILQRGEVLAPQHIMALSVHGLSKISVVRRPRVAILNTGNELTQAAPQGLKGSQIRNSSGPYLEACLQMANCEVLGHLTLPDDPALFVRNLKSLEKLAPDLILSTGAVSVGTFDFIKAALLDLGADIHFHKVSIRPGKPILFASLFGGATGFFGLPGNPIATVVGYRFFVTPYLRSLLGLSPETPSRFPLTHNTKKSRQNRCFYRARVRNNQVECLNGQASFMIRTLAEAQCWAILPEEGELIPAGQSVEVVPLHDFFDGAYR